MMTISKPHFNGFVIHKSTTPCYYINKQGERVYFKEINFNQVPDTFMQGVQYVDTTKVADPTQINRNNLPITKSVTANQLSLKFMDIPTIKQLIWLVKGSPMPRHDQKKVLQTLGSITPEDLSSSACSTRDGVHSTNLPEYEGKHLGGINIESLPFHMFSYSFRISP